MNVALLALDFLESSEPSPTRPDPGLGGSDRLRISASYRTPQTCHRPVVRRLLGGRGSDLVLGGVGNDVLLGGPGRDRANGRAGADICRAETQRDCER